MTSTANKQVPSHPFTMADVEVMRAMRIRLTHRKFRILLALQMVMSLLVAFWVVYIIASCTFSVCARLRWMNDWIVLTSLLLGIVNIAGVVVTVKRYRAALRFLRDPATHPDYIINNEATSSGTLPSPLKKVKTES
ncbi:hypothetical protein GGH12_003765 [Coemansia sp. RSA 1822]|nr:hypothetical protein LPJ76_005619 [Coemansia sp. RSA 638]KAJ2120519.1 hypothetical protein IW147_005009 [Coemansia sp. RSA 720]KAJ2477700.1 hypothetical protein IWW56_004176 [Coemansia sp. RSA 2131]KAJ2543140.1 hypothetical protein GGF49_002313 [Coemansia sp. RSA 1853]KAJ2561725.1 hypothetical protein GGH12_003765 [Coemansia sp. RSA 1822]KAJ2658187.1 hypothetical protein IW148_004819 [Coemansia sp. RSA 1199]